MRSIAASRVPGATAEHGDAPEDANPWHTSAVTPIMIRPMLSRSRRMSDGPILAGHKHPREPSYAMDLVLTTL